ncbi:MAG: serine/threonine-protein kinase [Ignavibacteriales bacterium]|nr:serine/threonine-protein kinase [Ignavibacteriales bacterium]
MPHISELMPQIPGYKIKEIIRKGGMGEVFLAEDKKLKRKVAIKSLAPELLRNPELIKRFKQEAIIQAKLLHPNIVTLFHSIIEQNSMYIVLEYAPGITLKEEIQQHGAMEEARVLNIFQQILAGVGFAHGKGIIHRDLKPSNIMLDAKDTVKIMDFGIAKVLGDKNMTKIGTKLGTLFYMSPEQVRGEENIDKRTDIYSLGIVLYEMLTGKLPFNTATASDFDVRKEIVEGSINDPRELRQGVSAQTISVMQMMIEKKKENRYSTCYECGIDLNKILIPPGGQDTIIVNRPEMILKDNITVQNAKVLNEKHLPLSEETNWSIKQNGTVLEIAYGSGTDFPQYAALHLESSYFRMNYGNSSGWGTSVILLPSFWSAGTLHQGAPITTTWKIDGVDIIISFSAAISGLNATGQLRITPPSGNSISASVALNLTGNVVLDNKPGEAFKPVMLSSMHISSDKWDAQTAYVDLQSYQIPQSDWMG